MQIQIPADPLSAASGSHSTPCTLMSPRLLFSALFILGAGLLPAGTLLDVDFSTFSPRIGTPGGIAEGERVQDKSGNNYHGFFTGGPAPVIATPLGAGIDTSQTPGHIVLRDGLAVDEAGWTPPFTGSTPAPSFTLRADKSYTFEAVVNWQGKLDAHNGLMGQLQSETQEYTDWYISENEGLLTAYFSDNHGHADQVLQDISALIGNDAWHHLAVVLDRESDEIRVYFDYKLIASRSNEWIASLQDIGDGAADIYLGSGDANLANHTAAGNRFTGLQARYRISDEALEPSAFVQLPAYSSPEIAWTGGVDATWDHETTPNWELPPGSPVTFANAAEIRFDDDAATGAITVDDSHGPLSPQVIDFSNETLPYSLAGAPVTGNASLLKRGAASLTLLSRQDYHGGTYLQEGTTTVGDGGSSGEIGYGPVTILEGATLRIHRSDLLDYSSGERLNQLSGSGNFVLDGGGTLAVNPATTGQTTPSWYYFDGQILVTGNSELQTQGNECSALGRSATVTLGDAVSSGSLAQINGDWYWRNAIVIAGPDNKIINRSPLAATGRSLILDGKLSGAGNLTFHDASGSMSDPDRGFILTGDSRWTGHMTVTAGTPVVLGSFAGPQASGGPDEGESLIRNDGFLTFAGSSRSASQGTISGTGEVRIGLSTGSSWPPELRIINQQTYTGKTTIFNGTLQLDSSLASPLVDVREAGTLTGSGYTAGDVVVDGVIKPDTSGLHVGGKLTLQPGSSFIEESQFWTPPVGVGFSQYPFTEVGALEFTGTPADPVSLVFSSGHGFRGFGEFDTSITLVTSSTPITGFDPATVKVQSMNFPGLGTWATQLSEDGLSLQLVYTASTVPDYDFWAAGFPGFTDTAPSADPDGDGVSNENEYAFGLDPTNPRSNSAVLQPLLPNKDFYYKRRSSARSGLVYRTEWSEDLIHWNDGEPAWLDSVDYSAETEMEEVRTSIPHGGASRCFVRITATPAQ